jgi:DNA-binding MarR family transcriptional regulator
MEALNLWKRATVRSLREMERELSPRQMALLLTVYLEDGPHLVRGLSDRLRMPKAAVCRALDVLGMAGLLRRRKDPKDKRNVLVQRTVQGSVFLSDFADILLHEMKKSEPLVEAVA